jgi:uncharacterized repeat protein (TIGR03806 family)
MRDRITILSACCLLSILLGGAVVKSRAPLPKLSDYGFFTGAMRDQLPAKGTVPYRLNTPLFSDHAEKLRFVRLPANASIPFNDSTVFDFPVGTALVKTFCYPNDARNPSQGRRLMETRVLLREEDGWKALPYVWDEEQSEAWFDPAGETQEVSYVDGEGRKRRHAYQIPNLNQCKGCHNRSETLSPIGPSARQLTGPVDPARPDESQLVLWSREGLLKGMPADFDISRRVVWNDPNSGSVEERARLWLDINCAHCHRPNGPAATSGLFLGVEEMDPHRLGIRKTPVAAGRGAGDLQYGIVPGEPDRSILVHRMQSSDPGVMMPELGRSQVDREAVALIRAWIKSMRATP